MASKYQSKASRAARLKANKGVAHGTRRVGAGGRVVRQWNKNTARWDTVGPAKRQAVHGQVAIAGSGKDRVNAYTSSGTAKTSSHTFMAESRKAEAARLSTARSRQASVKKAAAYGFGIANPVTRPAAFLTGAAEFGYKIGSSPKGKKAGKGLKNIAGMPSRWWSGY